MLLKEVVVVAKGIRINFEGENLTVIENPQGRLVISEAAAPGILSPISAIAVFNVGAWDYWFKQGATFQKAEP